MNSDIFVVIFTTAFGLVVSFWICKAIYHGCRINGSLWDGDDITTR